MVRTAGDQKSCGDWDIRLVATITTILLHVLLAIGLSTWSSVPEEPPEIAEDRIRLVLLPPWVQEVPKQKEKLPALRLEQNEHGADKRTYLSATPHKPLPQATEELNSRLGSPGDRPLDLRLPDGVAGDGPQFRSSVMLPRPADQLDRPPIMQLRIRDKSLGGRLQDMRRATMCGELRQAAAEARRMGADGRLAVIEQSMHEYHCR